MTKYKVLRTEEAFSTVRALKLTLAVLKYKDVWGSSIGEVTEKAIAAAEEALMSSTDGAQTETDWERIAWIKEEMLRVSFEDNKRLKEALAHRTRVNATTWRGLTPTERTVIIDQLRWDEGKADYLCRLVEAKLKEKNT